MDADSERVGPEFIRALCEMRGLGRALALFPDTVAAAFARGSRPIGSFPDAFSPTTEPACPFTAEPKDVE